MLVKIFFSWKLLSLSGYPQDKFAKKFVSGHNRFSKESTSCSLLLASFSILLFYRSNFVGELLLYTILGFPLPALVIFPFFLIFRCPLEVF